MDFFTVPTITFGVLYCFFVIGHDRRRIPHFNITRHPTSSWIIQQLRDAFPFGTAPRFLIHDRDAKYGTEVPAAIRSLKINAVRTSFESPWQNGIAERWVGSCRRERRPESGLQAFCPATREIASRGTVVSGEHSCQRGFSFWISKQAALEGLTEIIRQALVLQSCQCDGSSPQGQLLPHQLQSVVFAQLHHDCALYCALELRKLLEEQPCAEEQETGGFWNH
jgi:hypothetical protein